MNKLFRSMAVGALVAATLSSAAPVDMMIGARGYGMGGAYVALANDPSAAYWNPAGLARVSEISLLESNWILQDVSGLNVNYFSAALPVPNVGTVSGSWLMTNAMLEEGREANRSWAYQNLFSLSIGRELWDKLWFFEKTAVGFSINRETFSAQNDNGAGLGFDLAMQTGLPWGLSLGATWRTLGTDMMGEKVDPEVRAGLGYSALFDDMHRVTVGMDALFMKNRGYKDETTLEPAKNNIKGFFGLEYGLKLIDWEIALRGGGNVLQHSALQNQENYAFGTGITYKAYSFQYAFGGAPDTDRGLGYSHRVDFVLSLSQLTKKPAETE